MDESSSGLKAIRHSAIRTLRRFPGVLLVAALATGLFIHGILTEGSGEFPHWPALLVSLLGISWIYSLTLVAERRISRPWKTLFPLLLGGLSLGLYYLWTRGQLDANALAFGLGLAGLMVASHFFAAYAPFLGFQQPRAFWEYNRAIFLRFLLALLFSATLMGGIALFFGVLSRILPNFPLGILNFIMLALVAGVFNTWFFLAGVPQDFEELELRPKPYPRSLKFFAQFVLFPILAAIGLLMAILVLQGLFSQKHVDIGFTASFLGLGGFGLLAYLLLYPLEVDPRERSLRRFSKGFFLGLLPFLAILAFFITRLIWRFGWTPGRYYSLILALWGLALSLYLVIARRPRISWIPVSLSAIALLTVAGPWSALPMTRRSQNARLSALLGGKIPANQARLASIGQAERAKLEGQVAYLERNFGCEEIRPYFGDLLQSRRKEEASCSTIDLYRLLRRDASLPVEDLKSEVVNINFLERSSYQGLKVQGYDFYFPSSAIDFLQPDQKLADCPPKESGSQKLCVLRGNESFRIEIFREGRSLGSIDVEPMVQALLKKHETEAAKKDADPYYLSFDLSQPELSFETRLGGKPARVDFQHIRLERRGLRVSPEEVRFSLLFQEGS